MLASAYLAFRMHLLVLLLHICINMHYQQHASSTAYVRAPCILNPPKKKKPGVRVSEASSVSGLLNKKKRWRKAGREENMTGTRKACDLEGVVKFHVKAEKKKKARKGKKNRAITRTLFFPRLVCPQARVFFVWLKTSRTTQNRFVLPTTT